MGAVPRFRRYPIRSLKALALVTPLICSGCGNQDAGTVDLTAKPPAPTEKTPGKMPRRSLDIGGGANGPTSAPSPR